MRNTINTLALGFMTVFGLVACGGGGGDTPAATASAPKSLAGVAAVGYPIVGATITVRCAGGVVLTSQPTGSNGAWAVSIGAQSFPCAAQLNGGTINGTANTAKLHSLALGTGVMNITPLTDLMVAFSTNRTVPSDWFNGLSSTGLSTINSASLNSAFSFLVNALHMSQLGTDINPITTTFSPVPGTVMDDTLSSLSLALSDAGISYADFRTLVATPNAFPQSGPIPSTGILAALANRYSNSISGVRSFWGTNNTIGTAANGTPKTAINNCSLAASSLAYMKCQMNAIANFGPVTVVDKTSSKTCTASYANGILTVTDGATTVVGYMNGNILSDVNIFNSGTVERLNAWNSSANIVQINTLIWDSNGTLKSINGALTNVLSGTTKVSCEN